jgi:signal transduction histidine kinase
MIFTCWNISTRQILFNYSEKGDSHTCNHISSFDFKEGHCKCGFNRYFITKMEVEKDVIFAFCFDEIKVRKQAAFFAKHATQMFLSTSQILSAKQKDYEEIVKASVHSTRNLNSQITSKILNKLNEKSLARSADKVEYIESLIVQYPKDFAREVLSILRLSSQISSEYNVLDYLKPNIVLRKSEFGKHKIHSSLVLAFYQFDADFKANDIFVQINETDKFVYINFNTVQTILVNLYINALRYCMSKTRLEIAISEESDFVKVDMTMRSLYLTDEIIREGLLNGTRTEQAKRKFKKGTGLGLGIIAKLAELNKGEFCYDRVNHKEYRDKEGFIYSDNIFTIRFLKNEFYEE